MHDSPRVRRLRSDFAAMERLRSDSSVIRFRVNGSPPQHYLIEFRGKSLARFRDKITIREQHEIEIKLGASYPRAMPEIRWVSPIYHPNISAIGMVCLGGYGTHWVPSLNLDELCGMLWDMARFHNYDVRSPYNREAALWVAQQTGYKFPLDPRTLRDLRQALGRVEENGSRPVEAPSPVREKPGTLAAKYRGFLKRFADELNGSPGSTHRDLEILEDAEAEPRSAPVLPQRVEASNVPPEEDLDRAPSPAPAVDAPRGDVAIIPVDDEVIVLDSVQEPASESRPIAPPTARLRAADEEILFIE